ncbi:exopolysaccharide biosynthesis polyprenyl glycosylphosphotransferase [Hymenobacter nivis]|uniref:Exopolysaccharide biosynthesis polyprenyl glycosylphosphotransferase n=1 Tax=Hymenobacter nivis TaxID=1850093 RepID=A0A502GMV1_9BACT|nr:exopolysaccharide biosynthesis polyprenyl glycosylphosphotransferase [Hymenobacter nivis]TPG62842.1 exopolysaccharide biosynthesis polyprenyl glycosylphosphotransferase [Hymenobacter nivis]
MEYNFPLTADSYVSNEPNMQGSFSSRTNSFSAKRAFDIVFALLVVVLLFSWLIPLVALVIRLESKGPVFFKQLRTGKDNKPFYCFKFRSMHVNAEANHLQASRGDARITRVGAIIRKTNIDELPQFLNVLRGEMSIVGPRPHMLKHTEEYSQVVNDFMQRHTVTPGITGLAQVRGFRGETKEVIAMAKRVKVDIWYIKNWSLLLDVKIVIMTVLQAVKGHDNAF